MKPDCTIPFQLFKQFPTNHWNWLILIIFTNSYKYAVTIPNSFAQQNYVIKMALLLLLLLCILDAIGPQCSRYFCCLISLRINVAPTVNVCAPFHNRFMSFFSISQPYKHNKICLSLYVDGLPRKAKLLERFLSTVIQFTNIA